MIIVPFASTLPVNGLSFEPPCVPTNAIVLPSG